MYRRSGGRRAGRKQENAKDVTGGGGGRGGSRIASTCCYSPVDAVRGCGFHSASFFHFIGFLRTLLYLCILLPLVSQYQTQLTHIQYTTPDTAAITQKTSSSSLSHNTPLHYIPPHTAYICFRSYSSLDGVPGPELATANPLLSSLYRRRRSPRCRIASRILELTASKPSLVLI